MVADKKRVSLSLSLCAVVSGHTVYSAEELRPESVDREKVYHSVMHVFFN